MHLAEGVLSAPVLATGAALTAGGVIVGLRGMRLEDVPRVAVMSSAFFVASFIHVPVGPFSVHLVLNGLMGLLLGWAAFPAILIALTLQAVVFGYGGLTVLGVNTFTMATGALVCYLALRGWATSERSQRVLSAGALAGAGAVLVSGILGAAALAASGRQFYGEAALLLSGHAALMAVEALVTAAALRFLYRVRPETLRTAAAVSEGASHG